MRPYCVRTVRDALAKRAGDLDISAVMTAAGLESKRINSTLFLVKDSSPSARMINDALKRAGYDLMYLNGVPSDPNPIEDAKVINEHTRSFESALNSLREAEKQNDASSKSWKEEYARNREEFRATQESNENFVKETLPPPPKPKPLLRRPWVRYGLMVLGVLSGAGAGFAAGRMYEQRNNLNNSGE